jgi:plasmid stability protein
MSKVLIRNLEERVIRQLKKRAERNERSLQAELQMIIERAALADAIDGRQLAARIRRKLSDRQHSDSTALVAEDRRR